MSIEGGELDQLHAQLKDAQERRYELERQRDGIMGDLRGERQKAADAETELKTAQDLIDGMRRDLTESRRVSERVPKLEEDLANEQERHKTLLAVQKGTQADLAEARETVKTQAADLGNAKSGLAEAEAKLEKASRLAAAARSLRDVLAEIAAVDG